VDISSSHSGNEDSCGSSQYPCNSINKGIRRLKKGGEERKVNILTTFDVSGKTIVTNDESLLTLLFSSSLTGNEGYVLNNGGTASCKYLVFGFPSSFTNSKSSLILSSVGLLSMEHCSFKHSPSSDEEIEFSFLSLSSGSLSLTDVCCSSSSVSFSSFFSLSVFFLLLFLLFHSLLL
jgi:hypothetical protein